jgi:alkanesulfonate monooxygenase SsuD/methylene tetrahydromethanopterin reductase-like flavin-dependent oxidoreductase (luciferase family)
MTATGASAGRIAGVPLLGVTLPQFTDDPHRPVEAARHARSLGYAGAFVFDHLWPLGGPRDRPILECWTLLAALAAAAGAPGFRLGTLVTRVGLRPPALLATMAATLAQAAGAPMVVGVGGGDALSNPENEAYGLPALAPPVRAEAVERAVETLRRPLPGRTPTPEVWVGGRGRRLRAIAGRAADAWNIWGATPDELGDGLADVRRAAEAGGRDPAAVRGTWGGQVLVDCDARAARARLVDWSVGRDPDEVRRVLAGDPATVAAGLAALGEAGAAWCVLSFVGGDAAAMRAQLASAVGLGA